MLPRWLLTSVPDPDFLASLSIGFGPLLSPAQLWLGIGALIGLNIWMGRNLLGTVLGWQVFWAENGILVLLGRGRRSPTSTCRAACGCGTWPGSR